MEEEFFQDLNSAHTLRIRVIPNAKKTEIVEKMADGIWKIRVDSVPEDGKANAALLKYIKKQGKIKVTIIQGEKDRIKVLKVI